MRRGALDLAAVGACSCSCCSAALPRGRREGRARGRALRRVVDQHADAGEHEHRGGDHREMREARSGAGGRSGRGADLVRDPLGAVGRHRDLVTELGQQLFEYELVDHGVTSASAALKASGAKAASRGSAASRRRASCRRDLTVPGRRRMAIAISRSLRSEK